MRRQVAEDERPEPEAAERAGVARFVADGAKRRLELLAVAAAELRGIDARQQPEERSRQALAQPRVRARLIDDESELPHLGSKRVPARGR